MRTIHFAAAEDKKHSGNHTSNKISSNNIKKGRTDWKFWLIKLKSISAMTKNFMDMLTQWKSGKPTELECTLSEKVDPDGSIPRGLI